MAKHQRMWTRAPHAHRRWTENEKDTLRRLWGTRSIKEIAKELLRPVRGIPAVARKLGLTKSKDQRIAELEEEIRQLKAQTAFAPDLQPGQSPTEAVLNA